jgi:hypothetical protein
VARATASGEIRGSLSAPARLSGSLGIPIEGCRLSTGGPSSLVIQYAPHRLKIDRHRRPATRIVATVAFGAGDRRRLGGRLRFSLRAGGRAYAWTSVGGRLGWADGLRAGSFSATLRPSGGAARAPMRLRGSWRRCYTSPPL